MRHKPTIRRLLSLVGIFAAFALLAASCGDDEEAAPAATATETSTETETATETADEHEDEADHDHEDEAADEHEDEADHDHEDEADHDHEDEAMDGMDAVVHLGILGECEGAFGAFHEDVVGGASLPFITFAGGTSNSATSALEGFSGAVVAGVPIEVVGIGCGDDTPDRIIQEVRKIVEQDGANVVIGPLSGDESIAIANYAKDHPEVTFLNGIAGAQETTMVVQAPNFFRFNGDGAQWNAGLGDILHNEAGWETAAVIADDYSFGWTSTAGFIAEFCAVGGDVVSRVFPPLGTTDYSSYVQQLPDPDEVDGYFWAVGGSGTNASLEAFLAAKGDLTGDQHAGNLFFSPALAAALGTDIAGAYVGGFATLPGDVQTPAIEEYLASADAAWDSLVSPMSGMEPGSPRAAAGFGFFYGFYSSGLAFVMALEQVGGDLSNNHAALREALANIQIDGPYGTITLDDNRQAIVDTSVQQLVLNDAGEVVSRTVALIPAVDQSFGGTFSPQTPPPDRENPVCETRSLPWAGNAIPVVDGVPQR